MFNTLLNDNVLRIIRIKFVIRIIRNTRTEQLSLCIYIYETVQVNQSHGVNIFKVWIQLFRCCFFK